MISKFFEIGSRIFYSWRRIVPDYYYPSVSFTEYKKPLATEEEKKAPSDILHPKRREKQLTAK